MARSAPRTGAEAASRPEAVVPGAAAATEATRFVEPVVRPVVKATDLGSVQVLKQGNLYLLTDPFGDVHPDSRGLGLYDGDTRRLSCSILRVNGERPVLLQGSAGGNFHGAIQLTNPRLERNLAGQDAARGCPRLAEARHRAGPPDRVRDARGARPDRELRGARRGGRGHARARRGRRRHLRGPRLDAGRRAATSCRSRCAATA